MSQFFDIVDCDKFNQEQRKQMVAEKTSTPGGRIAAGGGNQTKTHSSGVVASEGVAAAAPCGDSAGGEWAENDEDIFRKGGFSEPTGINWGSAT